MNGPLTGERRPEPRGPDTPQKSISLCHACLCGAGHPSSSAFFPVDSSILDGSFHPPGIILVILRFEKWPAFIVALFEHRGPGALRLPNAISMFSFDPFD